MSGSYQQKEQKYKCDYTHANEYMCEIIYIHICGIWVLITNSLLLWKVLTLGPLYGL